MGNQSRLLVISCVIAAMPLRTSAQDLVGQDFIGDYGASISARTSLEEDQASEIGVVLTRPTQRFAPTQEFFAQSEFGRLANELPLAPGNTIDFCRLDPVAKSAVTIQPSLTVNEGQVRPGASLAYARSLGEGRAFELISTYTRTERKHNPNDTNGVGGQGKFVFFKGGTARRCQEKCASSDAVCDNGAIVQAFDACIDACGKARLVPCKRPGGCPDAAAVEEVCKEQCTDQGRRTAKAAIDSCKARCPDTPFDGVTLSTSAQATYNEHSGTTGTAVLSVAKSFNAFELNATAGWIFFRPESGDAEEDAFSSSFGVAYSFTRRLIGTVSYSIDNDVLGDDSWSVIGLYDLTPARWREQAHRLQIQLGYQSDDTFLARLRIVPALSRQ